jgi:hypothetical protein
MPIKMGTLLNVSLPQAWPFLVQFPHLPGQAKYFSIPAACADCFNACLYFGVPYFPTTDLSIGKVTKSPRTIGKALICFRVLTE